MRGYDAGVRSVNAGNAAHAPGERCTPTKLWHDPIDARPICFDVEAVAADLLIYDHLLNRVVVAGKAFIGFVS